MMIRVRVVEWEGELHFRGMQYAETCVHWHLCASCCCHVCCRSSISRLLVCGQNEWVFIIFMKETLKLN